MKRMIRFITLMFIFTALFCSFTATAQTSKCDGEKKMGIAIERSNDGQPEAPKSAWKFPAYKGGTVAMCKYLCKNMQYPASLKQKNINGVTTVGFIVNADGSISNVEVVKSSGYQEFDDEAVRLVKSFPQWKPAQKDCNDVEFKTQLDVEFNCEKCGCEKK